MGELLYFGLGLGTGGVVVWLVWWHLRREMFALDEVNQRLHDDRTIVVGFMHDLIESIGQGISREALLQQVVGAAVGCTGAMSACIFDRTGSSLRGVAMHGLFPPHRPLPESVRRKSSLRTEFLEQVLRAESFEVGEGLVGTVAQDGRGLLIPDAMEDPRIVVHEDPALQVRSVIVVPIRFRDQVIAVLAIVNRSDGMPFDEADFSLANALAEQAALAIQNLSLMDLQIERNRLEADLSLASNIQGMLLPSVFPSTPGLSVAALYEPAQKVGGDLYDLIRIDEFRYAVAVADVAGKGIPASLIMAITQSNLGHFARQSDSPLAAVRGLNEVICNETRKEMFVTLVYALVDLEAETLTVVRAGHEAPLLCSRADETAGARVETIKSRGMALGMVDDRIFTRSIEATTRPFRLGDVLLLFTDGIVEAANAKGEEFGGERLREVLLSAQRSNPEMINRQIRERVGQWSGSHDPDDDITLLCLKRETVG